MQKVVQTEDLHLLQTDDEKWWGEGKWALAGFGMGQKKQVFAHWAFAFFKGVGSGIIAAGSWGKEGER